MGAWLGWGLVGLVVLVVCSALLTGAEAAYFSLGRRRLRSFAAEGKTPEPLMPVLSRPHDLLVTLLVGITLVNVGASALAATVAEQVFGRVRGAAIAIGGMIFLLTVFGEVLPMTLALEHPQRFTRWAGRPVAWLSVLLTPVRAVLSGLTALTLRALGPRQSERLLTTEEIRTLVDVGAREGVVEHGEREMIHKALSLEDTLVREIMVPRPDMFCLDVATPTDQVLPALRENLHSRVPVYEESLDQIVGILYTKELLPFVGGLPPGFHLRPHVHAPYFVPETKRADALLAEFRAKKLQLAIVVDEYGGTAGLVTLEDLLEELVGEIADEFDEEERLIQRVDDRTFRVLGKLPIDQLNSATGLALSSEAYDTVGGWVLDLFGRIPHRGERIETPEATVTVEKVERTRVVEVLVTLRTAPDQAAA